MGQHEIQGGPDEARALEFERALLEDMTALEKMLAEGVFEHGVCRIGAEQELFLIDAQMRPAPVNLAVLEHLKDAPFTTEIGRYNLEANLEPQGFTGPALSEMERELRLLLARARAAARAEGADVVLCGILPTLRKSDLGIENLTPKARYQELDRVMRRLRGDRYQFLVKGLDELALEHDNVVLEACCTSFQVHFQVGPDHFAPLYNLAQMIAGPVLAAAVNSPVLLGRRLWQETRIAVFQHSVDERSAASVARHRPTRVGFGERWVDHSVLEVLQEDIARFRVLLTAAVEREGGPVPELRALRLHNGTIWRWNRPCYGITNGRPHLRIEARALPAGPSIPDEVANAAFHFGLLAAMSGEYGEIAKLFRFEDAKANFFAAARHGLSAQFVWLGGKRWPAAALILQVLLPLAHQGLREAGIAAEDRDRYLGILEERVRKDRTGSQWMLMSLAHAEQTVPREAALRRMTAAMLRHQQTNDPAHEWPVLAESPAAEDCFETAGDIMSRDLITVRGSDLADLAARIMQWRHLRHMPVEDDAGKFIGLVSFRELGRDDGHKAVWELMNPAPVTIAPETPTTEVVALMRQHRIDCLPVLREGKLLGVVTAHDLLGVLAALLPPKAQVQANSAAM